MRLDEYMDIEWDERAERRRLVEEKSYGILDHLETLQDRFEETVQGDSLHGGVSPSIFVGRSNYPNVSTGIPSLVGHSEDAAPFEASAAWYDESVSINDVFQWHTSLPNSNHGTKATNTADSWDGFFRTQREAAIADRLVTVEIGLDGKPSLDLDVSADDVATPVGPRAHARLADLVENPHVPKLVKKTLENDDWNVEGAVAYLYRRGLDVYNINTIPPAGAFGRIEWRRLVPTRWSITAIDDTFGQYLRRQVKHAESVDGTETYHDEFIGNAFWVILTPGRWEFKLIELKAPGSVWNPDPEAGMYLAADREGYEGRTGYVDETVGTYHASRLGVLEHLQERGRQAKALVIKHVSDDYWGPIGAWQIRESIRHAFEGEMADAEMFGDIVRDATEYLPVSFAGLRRKSAMAANLQTDIFDFA